MRQCHVPDLRSSVATFTTARIVQALRCGVDTVFPHAQIQELLAQTCSNSASPVGGDDEDPAEFALVVIRADGYVRVFKNIAPGPLVGCLQGCDCRERVTCRVIEGKPFCITNPAMQPVIRALEALPYEARYLPTLN
jgi:hypothetical protein